MAPTTTTSDTRGACRRARATRTCGLAAVALAATSLLAACGGGSGSGTTLAGITSSSTTVVTTTAATPATPATSGAPKPGSTPTIAVTTTKKPGPSAAEVADLERQLDEIDKALTDIQAELDTN